MMQIFGSRGETVVAVREDFIPSKKVPADYDGILQHGKAKPFTLY